jgi:DNA-binding NtrC family response regulator
MANILLIEGDAAVLGLLEAVLENEGHEVCSAATASEGYSVLRQGPIEMVIADLDIPKDEALEIVSVVTHDFPATKGIIVLGDADECSSIQAAPRLDVVEVVPKPIELSRFRRAVQYVLAGKGRTGAVVAAPPNTHGGPYPAAG